MTTTRVLVILSLTTTPSRVFFTPTIRSSPTRLRRPRDAQRPLPENGLGPGQIPPGDRHPRRILGHAHGQLEPQVEELLTELLGLLLQLVVGHLTPLGCLHGSPQCPPAPARGSRTWS